MTQVNMAIHPGMMPSILNTRLAFAPATARATEINFAVQLITSKDLSDYPKQEW